MVGKNLAEKNDLENLDYEAIYQFERYLIPIRRLCPGIDRRFGWEGSNPHHKAPHDWLKHYARAFHFSNSEIWAARTTADMPSASGVPVRTKADLEVLDDGEMVDGYRSGYSGEPEPGSDRSRSFWHGWRNGRVDGKHDEIDCHQVALAREVVGRYRGLN